MKNLVALATLFLLVMCGCGASLPTEDAAKEYVQQQKLRGNSVPVILVNFHRTNGEMGRNRYGVEKYVISYETEIEFTEDCFWAGGPCASSTNDTFWSYRAVKKGQREKISGKVYFDKTEKGWQPSAWEHT